MADSTSHVAVPERPRKRKAQAANPVEPPILPTEVTEVSATFSTKKPKKKNKNAKVPPTASEARGALLNDRGAYDLGNTVSEKKDDEELELEDLVFGGLLEGPKIGREYRGLVDSESSWLGSAPDADVETPSETGGDLNESNEEDFGFFIDTGGVEIADDPTHVTIGKDGGEKMDPTSELSTDIPAAWEDDDNVPVNIVDKKRLRKLRLDYSETTLSGKEYEARLRKQFQRIHPTPQWAEISIREQKNGDSSDDLLKILRTSMGIVDTQRQTRVLNPDFLEVVRLKDANQMAYSQAVVQSVQFHPKAPVLLTAGYDKTLRLFQIDGKVNPKIQSIYIKDLPIHQATFTPDGQEILITGKRKYFYTYNVEAGVVNRISGIRGQDEDNYSKSYVSPDSKFLVFAGRDGHMMVVAKDTKQWVGNMKMNGAVTSIDFSADGRSLYSFGGDGEVYQWDLGSRKCVHRFFDEGCVKATTLAVSGGSGYIATGSDSGVVNLYDQASCFASSNPAPQKAILNLTTSVTTLKFNHDSQILAMASREKKDSLRLLHVPTRRVFKNWPTAQTPLGYVNSLDFSPGGGYVAVGNDKGKVLLYRLNAYDAI
ncbi:hypothetical protein PhCBS80983_g01165 [Powellomyces hirtus]|uniref:U3 small nucleolar RNA-associated protein 18 homolog n=1 Tax=Powellomyces hirtus TaxID=109895 RepID=A0A507EDD6_9FUNG|nr:hypothetical protein PhCBS80983_g01165 [Powellomyces hirtus]